MLLDLLHLEVNFEWPTLESELLVHIDESLSVSELGKAYEAVGQDCALVTLAFLWLAPIKVLEVSHLAVFFYKLLDDLLRQVPFESRDVDQISVALVELILFFDPFLLVNESLDIQLLLPFQQFLADLLSAVPFLSDKGTLFKFL